jgi:DNA-binding NtrC family response regulator
MLTPHLQGKYDGIEAVRLMRSRVDAPVMYLTADSDTTTLEGASCTRPYAYPLKPFRLEQLSVSTELALYNNRLYAMARRETERRTDLPETTEGISPQDSSTHIEDPSGGMPTVAR